MTRVALPSGLVTFVLTDIEGSTKLFRRLGDAYPPLLETHNALLREQWATYGGAEVKTVSGKVLLGTTGAGRVTVRTVSGKVEIRVPQDVHPETRLKSISGRISNECPRGSDGEIAVASVSGAIRVSCG